MSSTLHEMREVLRALISEPIFLDLDWRRTKLGMKVPTLPEDFWPISGLERRRSAVKKLARYRNEFLADKSSKIPNIQQLLPTEYEKILNTTENKLKIIFDFLELEYDENNFTDRDDAICILAMLSFPDEFNIKIRAKSGAKKKWNNFKYTKLIAEIEQIKRQKICNDRRACQIYLTKNRKIVRPSQSEISSLIARLTEARNPIINNYAKPLREGETIAKNWLDELVEAVQRNLF